MKGIVDVDSQPQGRVLYVTVGAPEHGVVRHGRQTAAALRRVGAEVELLTAEDVAAFRGLVPLLEEARALGAAVHLDVTDALFGPTATAAADLLVDVLPEGTTLTLHDIPQPAEGDGRYRRRGEAYARLAQAVDGVVVSSQHERALLADLVDVAADVVPLPVEDRRAAAARAEPVVPESMAGLDRDLVLFGFVYPGKGHALALEALTELHRQWGPDSGAPRRLTALGPVSIGHDDLVAELTRDAEARGLEFRVTGFVPDEFADAALLSAGIPFAAHRNVSASGSLAAWTSVGRRAIASAGRYTEEMERLRPGTLRLVHPNGSPAYAMAEAIAEAVEDPERTWLGPGVDLSPGDEDCARMLFDVLRRVHRWT